MGFAREKPPTRRASPDLESLRAAFGITVDFEGIDTAWQARHFSFIANPVGASEGRYI
jgi:hypothetical protein